jgi:hypothetical protein
VRHNDISNILSEAPGRFEPIYRRKPNRDIDARPWCRGFYAAIQLRISAWAPLPNTNDINHGLLLPVLVHCVDDQGRPLLGPTRKGPEGKAFLRKAYTDIPVPVGHSNPNVPMVKPTQDWQGEHASHPLGVGRIGASFFSDRCLRLSTVHSFEWGQQANCGISTFSQF